jgi:hypothetical protein
LSEVPITTAAVRDHSRDRWICLDDPPNTSFFSANMILLFRMPRDSAELIRQGADIRAALVIHLWVKKI